MYIETDLNDEQRLALQKLFGRLTFRRSRDRKYYGHTRNSKRLGFDLIQFFPKDLEF